jgi:protein-S-isoprenylcysteine O-methyltransferase Ste14
MARSGAKRWLVRRVPAALERSLYVWLSSALFLATCAWWREIPVILYDVPWPWKGASRALQAWGVWLTLRSAGVIDPLELAGIRQVIGHVRPPAFKVIGPYRLVRHPIYFGWALMTFGTPLMTGTRLSFAIISTAYLMVAVPFEERSLVETFGDEYRDYQRQVRWRMVPGLY